MCACGFGQHARVHLQHNRVNKDLSAWHCCCLCGSQSSTGWLVLPAYAACFKRIRTVQHMLPTHCRAVAFAADGCLAASLACATTTCLSHFSQSGWKLILLHPPGTFCPVSCASSRSTELSTVWLYLSSSVQIGMFSLTMESSSSSPTACRTRPA